MNQSSSGSVPGRSTSSRGRRCTILIVEDHVDTIDLLRRLLTRQGHTVLLAANCAAALAVADRAIGDGSTVDLIIGDIGLPDGDGILLMSELKRRLGCPVVALTGHGMTSDLRRCADAGIDRHLLKPVGVAELNAEMERVAGC
jgi:CheY-like chemotaxis protein